MFFLNGKTWPHMLCVTTVYIICISGKFFDSCSGSKGTFDIMLRYVGHPRDLGKYFS